MKTKSIVLFICILIAVIQVGCEKESAENTQTSGDEHSVSIVDGALPGVFSVSSTKKVKFSQGNLQYTTTGTHSVVGGGTASGTWRFAEHQYDICGVANSNISSNYSGWIDLFGWGTSSFHNPEDDGNTNFHPYSCSTEIINISYNYYGYGPSTNMSDKNLTGISANYDWGVYNAISNGGNTPGLWRSLTQGEWDTLLYHRITTTGIRYAKATVNDVRGVIIVPDNWSATTHLLNNPNIASAAFSDNVVTLAQWVTLENSGCTFLPSAGYRIANYPDYVDFFGYYWSSTSNSRDQAYDLEFTNNGLDSKDFLARYRGCSVRLVKDVE